MSPTGAAPLRPRAAPSGPVPHSLLIPLPLRSHEAKRLPTWTRRLWSRMPRDLREEALEAFLGDPQARNLHRPLQAALARAAGFRAKTVEGMKPAQAARLGARPPARAGPPLGLLPRGGDPAGGADGEEGGGVGEECDSTGIELGEVAEALACRSPRRQHRAPPCPFLRWEMPVRKTLSVPCGAPARRERMAWRRGRSSRSNGITARTGGRLRLSL